MAKKRNYENDEAYKNFRVEDFLPEMKWREPEAKASAPEQEATTEGVALYPPLEEPDISAVQAAMPETMRRDGPQVLEDDSYTAGEEAKAALAVTDAPVERVVARRVSGKQRRLSLEEYRATYLQVPKIVNRKPVFVSETVRDELDRLVRLLGGKGMSASGLVENLVRLHLDAYRNDIEQWRRL